MADEQHELRRINWTQVFSFTHIFKSFKMAIHPSKMALCLAAIVVVFLVGWTMDLFWAAGGQYVQEGEILRHFSQPPSAFAKAKDAWVASRLEQARNVRVETENEYYSLAKCTVGLNAGPSRFLKEAFRDELKDRNQKVDEQKGKPFEPMTPDKLKDNKSYRELLSKASDRLHEEGDRTSSILGAAGKKALERIKAPPKDAKEPKRAEAGPDDRKQLEEHLRLARQIIADRQLAVENQISAIRGQGVFAGLLEYERACVANALSSVRYGNIFGGIGSYNDTLRDKAVPAKWASQHQAPPPVSGDDAQGFFYWCLLGAHGMWWLLAEHPLYAAIFLLASLAVVAFFGGAVHRIAALHFTREEKISIPQALRFSCAKFVSFLTAPLIPLAVIVGMGLVFLTVGGLIGSIPYVGEILMGLLFFLALAGGLVIAFLLVGLVTGAPLMYPTIAVEGSDSFDAISRSFSYVFSRPWRASLYGLVSLVYGVITYLFVRLFVYVAMAATHTFVGWGVFGGGDMLGADADKLDVMWPAPTFENLTTTPARHAMEGFMGSGAWLLNIWVFLLAAVVLAYLLSFAASSTTVIYCLLRRKVDATDLDDVYIEEAPEDEFSPQAQPQQPEQPAPSSQPPAASGSPGQSEPGQQPPTQ